MSPETEFWLKLWGFLIGGSLIVWGCSVAFPLGAPIVVVGVLLTSPFLIGAFSGP
jgi:hypothetical protein